MLLLVWNEPAVEEEAAVPVAFAVLDDLLAVVAGTGQFEVQGIALVKGKSLTLDAEAKAGTWVARAGFGMAPGPSGFKTLSMTCKTPFAISTSVVSNCALLI